MAGEVSGVANIEVFPWLKSMPVAPEYHPTLAEFQDPIKYIFKIEKEASKYGICKIVPPVPAASRKTIVANFNKSLLARAAQESDSTPTFTTRLQQIGFCPRKHRPVQKSVWLSGEKYTLVDFEVKAKSFEKSYLNKYAKTEFNALEMETLYWNATADKPFSVEYANDMPGSAFVMRKRGGKKREGSMTVGDTDWNMRGASRMNLSLLRFMKEEIPGVTSPMVYVAMMFSWFAWHVEDHDFHSLNFLHMGSRKTWYGVPREAASAFEEVIREHGYGGDMNPLLTYATLGEKTTVMSPEVLINSGVPCCRLVQNAGEFVVTFPRAYHSGFSHGFNCGEAANIATPEWLKVSKEAAVRRASINCPPMVSHFQLLYDLVLSLSRVTKSSIMDPRSSRLKDKNKDEGEMLIKDLFFEDMKQNNTMLQILGKGSSVVLLTKKPLDPSPCTNSQDGLQSLCSPECTSNDFTRNLVQITKQEDCYDVKENVSSLGSRNDNLPVVHEDSEVNKTSQCEQGLFTCVTCGIVCFTCVAIVQPTKAAAHYLSSSDCSIFNGWGFADSYQCHSTDAKAGTTGKKTQDGLFDVPVCSGRQVQHLDAASFEMVSNKKEHKGPSALGLLALTYGNSSDSEEHEDFPVETHQSSESKYSENGHGHDNMEENIIFQTEVHSRNTDSNTNFGLDVAPSDCLSYRSDEFRTNNCTAADSSSLTDRFRYQESLEALNSSSIGNKNKVTVSSGSVPLENACAPVFPRSDEDSSRLHVFCLQHAIEVEKQLSSIGGAHIFIGCHPDYVELESEAKKVAVELKNDFRWNEISFRETTQKDAEIIRLALDTEHDIHGNGDWAVKMGINLFYSANLSRSPLYCKQMPYNFVLYNAFARSCPNDLSGKDEFEGKGLGRQKRVTVAGKWCGKAWMSNQVHPLLVDKNTDEQVQEKNLAAWEKSDLRSQKLSECSESVAFKTFRSGRKRKNMMENSSHETEKSLEPENFEEFSEGLARSKMSKKIKNKGVTLCLKEDTVASGNSGESAEEFPLSNCWKQVKSKRTQRVKKESPEVELFYESSSEELRICDTLKQIKSMRKAERLQKESLESENFDESSKEYPVNRILEGQKIREKSKKWSNLLLEDEVDGGPSTRLRKRAAKTCKDPDPRQSKPKLVPKKPNKDTGAKKHPSMKTCAISSNSKAVKSKDEETEYLCDVEGCTMSFGSKQELTMHKRNVCPVRGCGKKFFSHKYLVQHRRVHIDDRPLKCPWKGCKMSFKWAWARTEHIRVHTGARPYVCTVTGCGQTFRFVSDFSRHKRKTGHAPKKARG